jgi:membrane-associated protein
MSLLAGATTVLANPIAPEHLLSSFGLFGLAVVLFAECGLLIGFFLPGDTILLAAGIELAVGGSFHSSLAAVLIVIPLAAVLGNVLGYLIGVRAGPVVFDRPNSKLFKPEYVARSQAFYDKYGWATVIIARFTPVVRTVAAPMAGVARMPFGRYVVASLIGGIAWADGIFLLGYWLGHIDFVRRNKGYIDYAVLAVIVIALLPTLVHLVRSRRTTS